MTWAKFKTEQPMAVKKATLWPLVFAVQADVPDSSQATIAAMFLVAAVPLEPPMQVLAIVQYLSQA